MPISLPECVYTPGCVRVCAFASLPCLSAWDTACHAEGTIVCICVHACCHPGVKPRDIQGHVTGSPICLQPASLVFWVHTGSQAGGGDGLAGGRQGRSMWGVGGIGWTREWEKTDRMRECRENNNRAHQLIENRVQSDEYSYIHSLKNQDGSLWVAHYCTWVLTKLSCLFF